MPNRAPYLIRTEDDESTAEDIDGAVAEASDAYEPSGAVPEIVDADGKVVFDPSTIVGLIIDYRAKQSITRKPPKR